MGTRAILVSMLVLAWASAAHAQGHGYTPGDIENGGQLYQANCTACHGPDGDGVPSTNLGSGKFRRGTTDDEIVKIMYEIRGEDYNEVYGARKMWRELRRRGHQVARCTVERLMRREGLSGAVRGRHKIKTTVANPRHERAPDLVKRDFTAPAPNRVWVADFTEVVTWTGIVYVAFIVDVYSRAIVGWAAATSKAAPLVVDDTVIVLPGGSNGQSVVGYDRLTGKRTWSALGDQQAYASPMLVTLNGVRQLLVVSATRMMGLVPGDGRVLWEYPFPTYNGINAAQPLVIGDNRVFVSASYGAGCAMVELSRDGDRFSVREVWRNNRMKNRFSGSVLRDGVIYGLDEGILAALDAETGELRWKAGRYGYGQILLAGDNLIVLTEDGDLALVRAIPDRHEELTRFPVLEGKTWNVPAIAGGYLLVRNLAEMAAFDLRVKRPGGSAP